MTRRDWLTRGQVEDWRITLKVCYQLRLHPEIDAMCDAALAALDADWQPISTAPKDGTKFLAAWGMRVNLCWWSNHLDAWCDDAAEEYEVFLVPTHWRPLPTPPQQKERPE